MMHVRYARTSIWALLACWAVNAAAAETPPSSSAPDGLIASPEPGWPQWRGRYRNGISDETGLLREWPQDGPKQLWKVEGMGTGWSSPIVVDGTLYITGDVGDELFVSAYDREGTLKWRVANGKAWTGPYPGARGCCAYSQGRLYHLNAHGRLACLNAESGKELWAVDVLTRFEARNIQWGLSESPLVDGQRVYVTPGGKQTLMAGLDTHDGRTVWTSESLDGDATSYSSPILFRHSGRRMLANSSAAHGFGIDADTGRLLWKVPLKNQFSVNVSTPEYRAGRLFFVTPYGEEGRAYDLEVTAAGASTTEVWKSSLDTVTGGAVVVDNTLFAAGYRRAKRWFAVDYATGQVKSELKDLSTGAAIYADGRLYCLDERGKVGLMSAEGGQLKLAGQFSLGIDRAGDAWTHPVLENGRLYLRYHDALWCYDVRGK